MALIAAKGAWKEPAAILWICARHRRHGSVRDKAGTCALGSVVIVSAEDQAETTTVPRLRRPLGADLSKIFITPAPRAMIQESRQAQGGQIGVADVGGLLA